MTDKLTKEKIPPQSIENEQSVLGSLILDADAFKVCERVLTVEDFYSDNHRKLYETLMQMHVNGQTIDMVTLIERLETAGLLDRLGGAAYLSQLVESVPTPKSIAAYAEIVAQKSWLRKAIHEARRIESACYNQTGDITRFISRVENRITKLTRQDAIRACRTKYEESISDIQSQVYDVCEKVNYARNNKIEIPGVSTGFSTLDWLSLGLPREGLTTLAARPKVGKTCFDLQMVLNHAEKDKGKPLLISMEMSSTAIIQRMASQCTGIYERDIRTGKLSNEEWKTLGEAIYRIRESGITIIDQVIGNTPEAIISAIRYSHQKHNHTWISIENVQSVINNTRKPQAYFVQEFYVQMEALQKELKIPIVLVAQLKRKYDKEEGNKRPTSSDLRDSGGIEQTSALVLALHRPDRGYEKKVIEDAEILIMENRFGDMGMVKARFEGRNLRFYETKGNERMEEDDE